jgi:thioredoxin-disulfide reductase
MVTEKYKDLILEPRQKYNYDADEKQCYDMIIVGAGVVGFSTAMYASRLGLSVLIIGKHFGGTLTLTDAIENWPGIVSVQGMTLAKLVENHARDYPIHILRSEVTEIKKLKQGTPRNFKVNTKKGNFKSKTIVFATGTETRKLGIPGEKQFFGRGVSYCALCDGPLYNDKTVGVVGGSDSAVKEAILLSKYAKKVYIIYRGEKVHPEPITLLKLKKYIKNKKIEIINNTNLIEIKGQEGKLIENVVLDKVYQDKQELHLDGLFVYIGHIPLSSLAKSLGVKLNKKQEIIINRNSETNIKGIFSAGDVADTRFKQAITGAAEGVSAAYSSYEYIQDGEFVLSCNN